MVAWQGYRDLTYFGCGDPTKKKLTPGACGAVVSFRVAEGDGGLRGKAAFDAFNRRPHEQTESPTPSDSHHEKPEANQSGRRKKAH